MFSHDIRGNGAFLVVFVFNLFKQFLELEREEDCRKGYRQHVGDGLCHIHACCGVADQIRHNINERQQKHKFSDHRHDHRGRRASQRHEGHLTRDLDAEQKHTAKINAECARGKADECCVGGEYGGEHTGEEHYHRPYSKRIA